MIEIGLCAACVHHRVIRTRRGSSFHLCELSREDSAFRKYPPLPVLECAGFEAGGGDPWDRFREPTREESG